MYSAMPTPQGTPFFSPLQAPSTPTGPPSRRLSTSTSFKSPSKPEGPSFLQRIAASPIGRAASSAATPFISPMIETSLDKAYSDMMKSSKDAKIAQMDKEFEARSAQRRAERAKPETKGEKALALAHSEMDRIFNEGARMQAIPRKETPSYLQKGIDERMRKTLLKVPQVEKSIAQINPFSGAPSPEMLAIQKHDREAAQKNKERQILERTAAKKANETFGVATREQVADEIARMRAAPKGSVAEKVAAYESQIKKKGNGKRKRKTGKGKKSIKRKTGKGNKRKTGKGKKRMY